LEGNNNNPNNNNNVTQDQANIQPGLASPQSQQTKKTYTIISYNRKNDDNRPTNNLEKLIMERDQLLSSGMYKESDPLIFQMNNKIKKMTESFGGY